MKIIQIQIKPSFSYHDENEGEDVYQPPALLGLSDEGSVYEFKNKEWKLII